MGKVREGDVRAKVGGLGHDRRQGKPASAAGQAGRVLQRNIRRADRDSPDDTNQTKCLRGKHIHRRSVQVSCQ